MFEGLPWEVGQDRLEVLAGRSLREVSPLLAADALLSVDPLALLDLDQSVAEEIVAQLQVALNQVAALQAILIETVARRVEHDVEVAKDDDRLSGHFPAGWGTGDDYTPSVLAPLLHLPPRTMAGRLGEARVLVNELPRTLRAALDGELEPWRVGAVVAGAFGVSAERMPDYEVALFGEGGLRDATAGVLRKRAERVAAKVDAGVLAQRVVEGRRSRCVRVSPGALPGTTQWSAMAAADRSAQAWGAVCELADEYLLGKPELTPDQARADAFLDLLLRNVQVQMVVTIGVTDTTIAALLDGQDRDVQESGAQARDGQDRDAQDRDAQGQAGRHSAQGSAFRQPPALGDGSAPIPAPALPYLPPDVHPPFTRTAVTTRLFSELTDGTPAAPVAGSLASRSASGSGAGLGAGSGVIDVGACGWLLGDQVAAILRHPDTMIRLARLDPRTGATAYLSSDSYRPGAALARLVRERDGTCRFPGCRVAAARCDLDHAVPFPQGPTDVRNLHCLCRRHHGFKHHAGWSVDLAWDGTLTWTSPTGRQYVTLPHDRRESAA
jgi:hypothetical protein